MSNAPNFRAPIKFAEFAEKRRTEGTVVIELPEGDPITIPPPEFWTREARDFQAKIRRNPSKLEEMQRAVIGDAEFDRFAAAVESVLPGTSPADWLNLLYDQANRDKQGVTAGE